MRSVRVFLGVMGAFVFIVMVTAISLHAQTAATSVVTGTVYDSTGALVPNARVEIQNIDTKEKTSTTTGSDGGFTFPSVRPGNYTLTVSAKGFRQAVVSGMKVEIGKSALVNVALEVGEMSQVVEVTAGAAVELQTLDASVGNVLDSNILRNLPSLNRDATSLLMLQPLAIPGFNTTPGSGESNGNAGVAGSRFDQQTFLIDGGDATSNMEGGGGYNTGFQATPRAVVPTPVESLEEFRVTTNNPNASFARAAGSEVQMVTKSGTNAWHGAGYWYHQNDEMNANSWKRNSLGQSQPELRDNRYGGRLGGPIWKDRTFFFVHEEERHFFRSDDFTRLVPTAALRVGIIERGGVAYNLNPTPTVNPGAFPGDPLRGQTVQPSGFTPLGTLCTPTVPATAACSPLDPRQKGLSPAIAAEWNTMPLPNDFSQGDSLRTAGFSAPSPETTNEHFAVARLDHKINDKWDAMLSYRYSTTDETPSTWQVDISGTTPGCKSGVPCPTAKHPLQPRFFVGGLTGRITPNLVNEFHFDWLRHWWDWTSSGASTPVIPTSLLKGDTRLQIWRESQGSGMVPINMDTQHARQRVWNGQDYTWIDNLNWIKGKHVWQFGGRVQVQHFLHIRDDKVVGGITTPIYYVARGGDFTNIDASQIPSPSGTGAGGTTWNRAYISALGMVDAGTQVLTRDANYNPQAPFTNIVQKENVDSYEIHFSDTVRLTPSLTAVYGLTWGVQMPPYDTVGKTTMMVDTSSGQIIDADSLLNAKKLAGLNGIVVNPTIGYVPIRQTGRKYPYDPDYTNFGPRLAVAWNPSIKQGFLGNILGDRKTVIRAGWSRAFDRLNGVGLVLTPALGAGFGDLSVCAIPSIAGVCGAGGTPSTNFRIGTDGNGSVIKIPTLSPISGALIPGLAAPLAPASANSVYENRDFRIDPRRQVGGTDMIDLSVQRELPVKMLLEVGYVGRVSRDLVQQIDLNHIPYMFTPKSAFFGARATNQSFAQAFDAVAAQLQGGVSCSITKAGVITCPLTPQPWFTAMMGGTGSSFCSNPVTNAPIDCTVAAGLSEGGNFAVHAAGLTWFDLEPSFMTGPMTSFSSQVKSYDWTTGNGYANYNAAFISLRKRPSHGLAFDFNYTLSHSLDTLGLNQESTCAVTDAYYISRNYEPSLFDRRHTFNLLLNYELPMGKGKGFATSPLADRVLGGWSVSSVYTAASGLPNMLWDDSSCGTEFGSTAFNGDDTGLIPLKSGVITTSTHNGSPPNALSNAAAASANLPASFGFRYETFADNRTGFGAIRGLWRWNVDFALAKTTRITERVSTRFDVQFINAFNHPMLQGSSIFGQGTFFSTEANFDVSDPGTFGTLPNNFNAPRFIQLGLRFDF